MFELMKSNYLKEVSIQEELEKVKIENFLEFYSDGRYEFYKCPGCFGPQLGYIEVKCTKIAYESDVVRKFKVHLKKIKGFKEGLGKREKEKEKLRPKEMVEAAAAAGNRRRSRRSSSDSEAKTTTPMDRTKV